MTAKEMRPLWNTLNRTYPCIRFCDELRPDGGLGLVGQLCSFVLGPTGVGEIVFVGEVCDVCGGPCFLLEEKRLLHAYATQELEVEPPLQTLSGEEIC